ncbi:CMGC kinase [Fusarium globosum]|uniref:CMGC kinase n=1 Tax=Fusarium globosum TaxID=78864 RepID=A0A8H5YYF6_9HYPO|nr:CMGC kinase [Fusarium globosum]
MTTNYNHHTGTSAQSVFYALKQKASLSAPELLTGEPAHNSDLWSFGCIILHFIVWYHGGWALVNALSALSSAEEEEECFGAYTDDDKFFKYGNLMATQPGGEVIGQGKDVPNTIVLKESIKQEISKYLEQGKSHFVRDIIGRVKKDLLQADAVLKKSKAPVYTCSTMCSNVEYDDTRSSLHTLLWERKARHSDPRSQLYWPYELLIGLMTPSIVYSKLISSSIKERNAAKYRDLILGRYGSRPTASPKTYRRILAILVLQNRVSDIGMFLREKLHDESFPLDRPGGRDIAVKCFKSLEWEDEDIDCFNIVT